MSKTKYEVITRDVDSALTAFQFQLLGVRINYPEPFLTSRDMNAVDTSASFLESNPVFENSVYQDITLFEKGAKRTNSTALDNKKWCSDLKEKIKENVKTPSTPLKTWHAQVKQEEITIKRAESIFDIGVDAGLDVIELPIPISLDENTAMKFVNDHKELVSNKQNIFPVVDADIPPVLFEAFAHKLIEEENLMLGIRRAPIASSEYAAQNYRLIEQVLSKKMFITALELTNPSKKDAQKPHRGVQLVRNYGISAFSYLIRRPIDDSKYTIENARRFDNAQELDLINMGEHRKRHGLDLNCECEACIGKDATQYYGIHSDGQVYSSLSAVHTARSLPISLRGLIEAISKP